MLYLETAEGFAPWLGQAANDGCIYSRDIATNEDWDDAKRAAIGLFSPVDPGIPAGHRQVGERDVARVNGVVTFVYATEPIPAPTPSDVPLTDRQLRIGLLSAGYSLAIIEAAIDAIPDLTDRAIARVWWERTTLILWDHPMTQTLMGLAGIPENERTLLWMWASDIPA